MAGQDHVVEHGHTEQLTSAAQRGGDDAVSTARRGVAARMVVADDDSNGIAAKGGSEDITREQARGVDAAHCDRLLAYRAVAGIEQQHHDLLAARAPERIEQQQRVAR